MPRVARLRVIEGGRRDVPAEPSRAVVGVRRPPAVRARRVSVGEAAAEHLHAVAWERETPRDADDRLPWFPVWDLLSPLERDAERARLRRRIRETIQSWRIVSPPIRLSALKRWTPEVDAEVRALAARFARELVHRVRNGGADDSSVPIEVDLILEVCGWFEKLGALRAASPAKLTLR